MFSNLFEASTYLMAFICSGTAFAIFVAIIICALIALSKALHHATLHYEIINGTATIIAFEREEGPALFGDEYFVHLTCAGKDYRLLDEDLYHTSSINGLVPVQIHLGFNRSNTLVHQYITKH